MNVYQRAAAYLILAGAVAGCGKDASAPSQLEQQVQASEVGLKVAPGTVPKGGRLVSQEQELDLSTPEKVGDAYLTAYENADYDKLLQMTTDGLQRAFKEDSKEQVIKELRESILKSGTPTGNVINRVIVYGPASREKLRKVRELKANEAEVQYTFNNRFGGFDGNGKLSRWTLRLKNVGNTWLVYDQ